LGRRARRITGPFYALDEQRRRQGEPDRLRRPEVHAQLEVDRLLDGNVARPRAAKDAVDEVAGAQVELVDVGAVGHQPAGVDGGKDLVHDRHAMPLGEAVDLSLDREEVRRGQLGRDHGIDTVARHGGEGRLEPVERRGERIGGELDGEVLGRFPCPRG
jgi:hypothetical protein